MDIVTNDRKELFAELHQIKLSDTSLGLEKLYIGMKFCQLLCIEINTTPDIAWDRLMKDYRLSLISRNVNNKLTALFNEDEINLQYQLRDLTTEYLDTLSPNLTLLIDDIKLFCVTYNSYFNYLKPSIEKLKSNKKTSTIIIDMLKKNIQKNKEKVESFLNGLSFFTNKSDANYAELKDKEADCEAYLQDVKNDIELIFKKINDYNENIKEKNIQEIKRSYEYNSEIVFAASKKNEATSDDNNVDIAIEVEILIKKLKNYDKEYAALVKLNYLAQHFNEAVHTIKLGTTTLLRSWVDLFNYFDCIKLRLEKEGEEAISPIINELEILDISAKEVNEKLKKLSDTLTMRVATSHDKQQNISVIDNSVLLKLTCQ